jgi:hypothetical protein
VEEAAINPSLVLRPKLSRQQPDVSLLGIWVAVVVVLGLTVSPPGPAQMPTWIALTVVPIGLEAWALARRRITVMGDHVEVGDTVLRPRGAVPRAQVASIHIRSDRIWICDHAGHIVLTGGSYWTKGQLLDLAEELAVPLFDHRRWGGLSDTAAGTELTRARAARQRTSHRELLP